MGGGRAREAVEPWGRTVLSQPTVERGREELPSAKEEGRSCRVRKREGGSEECDIGVYETKSGL
jgi:hypothetical protein